MRILFIFKGLSENECTGNQRDLVIKRVTKPQPYKIKEKKKNLISNLQKSSWIYQAALW